MKYLAIIKDSSSQYGGEVSIVCFTRREAIIKASSECLAARSFGIKCYAKVLPKKLHVKREFKKLGWLT
jgi:hypothetical protein